MEKGGRRKQQAIADPGPWAEWPEVDASERAIRFIETYCRAPKGYGHGKPLALSDSQKEWLREILAEDITSAVKSCPRGQGKSTELAALAVWATFDGLGDTGAPQVPIIATRTQQAIRSIYGVAVSMVKAEPELANRSIIYTAIGSHRIHVQQTGGECFPIANNVDGLQGLDPSLAIADEIGFQPIESWDSLVLASGKRERSLVVGTGTPGFDRDNALWTLRQAWLEAGGDLPGFSYTEIAAPDGCDLHDEDAWREANPALDAGYQNIDALRTAVKISPEAHFRIFHLGQWVDGTDSWLGADGRKSWEDLTERHQMAAGARTWVGVDVGVKRDSTAVCVAQRRPDGRLHVSARIWLPTKAETIELSSIMKHLRDLDALYNVEAIAYDPRLFEVPAQMLTDEGLPMVEYPQSLERMTPAFGALLEAIKRAEITHDGDVAFGTQILNAIPRYNERGFTLMKAKSRGRIDAAYALAMCHDQALRTKPPKSPVGVW